MGLPERWNLAYFNDEMDRAIGEGFAASDAMLMGRILYEECAAYWPEQDPEENPFAAQMNGVQKHVVSTTLERPLGWQNSTLSWRRNPPSSLATTAGSTATRRLSPDASTRCSVATARRLGLKAGPAPQPAKQRPMRGYE